LQLNLQHGYHSFLLPPTRGFLLILFTLAGRHPLPLFLFGNCCGKSISDCRFAGELGCRSDGGHYAIRVPVIVHGVTVPSADTASSRDSVIGHMLI
jgi:hypothetical protein